MNAPRGGPVRLVHFAMDGDTSGFFPQLAHFHDRSRYRMIFATLRAMTPGLRKALEAEGVEALSLDAPGRPAYPLAFVRLVAELRRRGTEIFHAHLFDPSVVGLPAAAAAGVPVRVMTRHYSDYHTRIDKHWHVRLDRLCTRLSHRVIAVSRQTQRVMVEEEHAPADKIEVIHNGVDFRRVPEPSESELEALRAELGANGAAVLTVMARFHPEKGQEHLFRAMPEILAGAGRPVVLLVAGTGTYQERYEAMVRELGLEPHVRFLGFRGDPAAVLGLSDIVVLPSTAEAFGLVLVEAMSLGKPVVASRVGGIPEIVEDGATGVLVRPGSPPELSRAVLGLLRDPERRARLGEAGRRAAQRFRFDRMMRAYEDVYERLLSERGVRA